MAVTARFLMPAGHHLRGMALKLETKSVNDEGEFEGYASLFNTEDLGRDVVAPGAFRDSLAQRGAGAIRMLFQHDPSAPIGVWDEIREDARGLYVRGRLMTAVEKAREVLALMRAGALDGLSIGFKPLKTRRDARSGARRIEKVDLWEISVVTFPMLPGARVGAVKQRPFEGRTPTAREFERWLTRDAGLTRSQAQAVLHYGLKGLTPEFAAGGSGDDDGAVAARIRAITERMQRDVLRHHQSALP